MDKEDGITFIQYNMKVLNLKSLCTKSIVKDMQKGHLGFATNKAITTCSGNWYTDYEGDVGELLCIKCYGIND